MADRALSDRLIADGLQPVAIPDFPTDLRTIFHGIAMDVLKRGAPGLTEVSRNSLAISIALRCERAAQKREKAA